MTKSQAGGLRPCLAAAAVAAATFLAVRMVLPDTKGPTLHGQGRSIDGKPVPQGRGAAADLTAPQAKVPPAVSNSESAAKPATAVMDRDSPGAEAPAKGPDMQVPAKALVYGTATDGEDVPVGGVLIHTRTRDGLVMHTKTDKDGRYAFGPLAAGQWIITVYIQGRHCPSLRLEIDEHSELLRRDLVLPVQQLVSVALVARDGSPALQRLRAAGLPASRPALVAVATLERPAAMVGLEHMDLTQTFGVGRQLFGTRPSEPYAKDTFTRLAIQVQDPTWISLVSHHCVLQSMRITPDDDEARFVVEPEDLISLRGVVMASVIDGSTGAPVAAKISAGPESSSFRETAETVADGVTGSATLESVAPGPGRWFARADGYATIKRKIVVPKGGVLDLGVISLERPVSLSGSVRSPDGQPLESVLGLRQLDPSDGSSMAVRGMGARSGPDGRFRIEGLLPAHYALLVVGTPAPPPNPADPALRSHPLKVDATAGPVEDIRLETRPTTRVTFPVAKFQERWPFLRALNAESLVADTTWLGRWFDEAWIDVLPGKYSLEVRRIDDSIFLQELVVGDQPLRMELRGDLEEKP